MPDLLLLTRPKCHLCADARIVVARVAADLGLPWREESLVTGTDLWGRFAEDIPVVMINGVQRDFWQIDEARLRGLLSTAMRAAE